MTKTIVAAIQMSSGPSLSKNLKDAAVLIAKAAGEGAKLLVLPENFALMTPHEKDKLKAAEKPGEGPIQAFLAAEASRHGIWLVGGTQPRVSPDSHKIYNSCAVYNDRGQEVAVYHKIHLFDAKVRPGLEVYEESSTVYPGDTPIAVDTPWGRLGLAICYDLRFPELFRRLSDQGAELFALPTAFTVKTGEAHWEVLTRARAIENVCPLIGACQTGTHAQGRQTYGHSLIIDPWGTVLNRLPDSVGFILAEINSEQIKALRHDFPIHQHRRL